VRKKGGVPDVRSKLQELGYDGQSLCSTSGVAEMLDGQSKNINSDCSFYREMFQAEPSEDDVSFFSVSTQGEEEELLTEFKCFYKHSSRQFFVQAPATLSPPSCTRSAVVGILEFAEEMGAKQVYLSVAKQHKQFAETVRVFLYLGFEIVDPRVSRTIVTATDVVLLGYNIGDDIDE